MDANALTLADGVVVWSVICSGEGKGEARYAMVPAAAMFQQHVGDLVPSPQNTHMKSRVAHVPILRKKDDDVHYS